MKHLTEEQKLTLDMVRDMVTREIAPLTQELDEKSLFPEHARDLFAQLSLLNPLLSVEYGGAGMSISTLAMVLEDISKVCASTALLLIAQTDGMLPIIHGGSPELKERFLRRFEGESRLLTALGATERNAGSDLRYRLCQPYADPLHQPCLLRGPGSRDWAGGAGYRHQAYPGSRPVRQTYCLSDAASVHDS